MSLIWPWRDKSLLKLRPISPAVIHHQFWSDEGGEDLGHEIDLVASKQLRPMWSMLVKAAFFDGHNGQPDTTRLWVQTKVKF